MSSRRVKHLRNELELSRSQILAFFSSSEKLENILGIGKSTGDKGGLGFDSNAASTSQTTFVCATDQPNIVTNSISNVVGSFEHFRKQVQGIQDSVIGFTGMPNGEFVRSESVIGNSVNKTDGLFHWGLREVDVKRSESDKNRRFLEFHLVIQSAKDQEAIVNSKLGYRSEDFQYWQSSLQDSDRITFRPAPSDRPATSSEEDLKFLKELIFEYSTKACVFLTGLRGNSRDDNGLCRVLPPSRRYNGTNLESALYDGPGKREKLLMNRDGKRGGAGSGRGKVGRPTLPCLAPPTRSGWSGFFFTITIDEPSNYRVRIDDSGIHRFYNTEHKNQYNTTLAKFGVKISRYYRVGIDDSGIHRFYNTEHKNQYNTTLAKFGYNGTNLESALYDGPGKREKLLMNRDGKRGGAGSGRGKVGRPTLPCLAPPTRSGWSGFFFTITIDEPSDYRVGIDDSGIHRFYNTEHKNQYNTTLANSSMNYSSWLFIIITGLWCSILLYSYLPDTCLLDFIPEKRSEWLSGPNLFYGTEFADASNTVDIADPKFIENKEVELGYSKYIVSGQVKFSAQNGKAEFLWLNCRLELIHAKKALEDLESYASEERLGDSKKLPKDRLSGKADIHKAANCLHPQVKKILLDCLRERNLMLPVCGEEKGFKSWYTRYLGFLFANPDSSSRRELIQRIGEAPSPAPTVSPPSQATLIPAASNAPFPTNPPWLPFFLPDLNDSSLQIKTSTHSSRSKKSASKKQSSKKESNKRTVIAAVAIAAVSLVAALSCFCCCRCCRTGNRRGRNDEKPLLCLSLSDYSIASSRKSFDLATLMKEDQQGNQLFHGSLNRSKSNGKFYADSEIKISVGTTAGSGINSRKDFVQMPSGMLGKPGCPPLKPPPGRTNPPKPPLGNTAPPPPPPAPPINPTVNGNLPPPGAPLPPPITSGTKTGPRPPPPPGSVPPPRPPPVGLKPPRRSPLGPNHESTSTSSDWGYGAASKTKLKPFFWDKVSANPDNAMVWDQIRAGSFQFNEEMIENLFGYDPAAKNESKGKKGSSFQDSLPQHIQIIDQKKSQNLSIFLKALNVTTEEISDALQEGNELPTELIQNLLKMAPTSEEELKLRLYSGELSHLGPADRFLKVLVEIPFAFRRLETLLLMCTLQEETSTIKESFQVLEVACTELRKSRLFLKLLEAVLKTGNRMNDGTYRGGAQAFKLDTLLKLADVKGKDGKTTLLHFVVQEIIRSEGIRAARAAQPPVCLVYITLVKRGHQIQHDTNTRASNNKMDMPRDASI
ncbi:uncharacterized protein LOC111392968 [Olea europaea var. sylvestris]|uniref:uncharacterized protein LOC111392968 n=1 Tax=Olea europaea var. sylvestris TaxID=158386 RepID=UPI000C1CFC7A|nr:uncharacterized protein LOC111392968 [Olea europaea var. sylvestris]